MNCELWDAPDIELYFYGELDELAHARVAAHLRTCAACRQRLDDLRAIRRALAARAVVDGPPSAGDRSTGSGSLRARSSNDWSGFMRRLDAAVGAETAGPQRVAILERTGRTWSVRQLTALAATLAVVALGVFMASRVRPRPAATTTATALTGSHSPETTGADPANRNLTPTAALRDVSAGHLERSKLVVLGLAARDPEHTKPADWEYERTLAGTLLPETRLYRMAAQERGAADVAHVMRDLETVLLEASMNDKPDRESLERVQRLIARRGLVTKMQMVATSAGL
jgi:hypothetical protein